MARVNVRVDVDDLSGSGLRQVRRSLNRLQGDLNGLDRRVRLTIPTSGARRDIRRVRRLLDGVPNNTRANITVTTTGTRREGRRIAALRRSLPDRHRIRVVVVPPSRGRLSRIGRMIGGTVGRHMLGPFRIVMRTISGMLSDGIGQGIIGAFKAAGPIGIAVLASIIAGAVTVVGAALAGLLVLAFGGALVGLGAVFAAKSEVIQRNWKKATKNMGEDLKAAAEPLVPVMHGAIHQLEGVVDDLAVKLKDFFEGAAPHLKSFLKSMEDGFRKFGAKAWEPMTEAFNVFLAAFGPQWEGFMEDLGSSFGALGRTVSSHSTEIGMALRTVLHVVVLLVDTINILAQAWAGVLRAATFAFGGILTYVINPFVQGVFEAFSQLLNAATKLFGKIPGLGSKLKESRKQFDEWRADVGDDLDKLGRKSMDFGKRLDRANKKRKLEVDIASWKSQLEAAKKKLASVPKSKKSKVQANINDLKRKIRQANAELASLKNKTVVIRVDKYTTDYYSSISAGTGRGGLAHGGIVGKAATGGARSNMTLVGERGPEIVNLAPGSHVRSNADSRRLLGGGGGGGGPATIVIKSGGSKMDDLMVELLRRAFRRSSFTTVDEFLGGRS